MKKVLVVAALLIAPVLASATCTWTQSAGLTEGTAVCTSVAETAVAGAAGQTVGWQTSSCPKGMAFTVCTAAGQAVTAALTLSVYGYNPQASLWAKWPDRNMTSETITSTQRCQTFDAIWTVVSGGRIAVLPTAGTVDGGNVTIYWSCN